MKGWIKPEQVFELMTKDGIPIPQKDGKSIATPFYNRIFRTNAVGHMTSNGLPLYGRIYASALKFGDVFALGYSYCSPYDQFNRKKARVMAEGRAFKALTTLLAFVDKHAQLAKRMSALEFVRAFGDSPHIRSKIVLADSLGNVSLVSIVAGINKNLSWTKGADLWTGERVVWDGDAQQIITDVNAGRCSGCAMECGHLTNEKGEPLALGA